MKTTDSWIETPRGRLYARRLTPSHASDKAPLVMLHDSLGCVDLWGSLPRQLAEATSRDVIAYDRLGYGRSDARPDRPKHDFIREEVEEFFPYVREAMNLSRFALFGHSVGGGMAITLGALEPNACVAVISESAQAIVEPITISGIKDARRALENPEMFARLASVHGEKTQTIINMWSEAWLALESEGWTLTGNLPALKVPMLVIHGEKDEFGSLANPEALKTWGGDLTQVEIFKETKHIPHREHRERVIQTSREFLSTKT